VLFSSVISAMTVLTMEAVRTSEASECFYQTTRRNIPEDKHLHACRRENLKSQLCIILYLVQNDVVNFRMVTKRMIVIGFAALLRPCGQAPPQYLYPANPNFHSLLISTVNGLCASHLQFSGKFVEQIHPRFVLLKTT
jgi:hypothetical protein